MTHNKEVSKALKNIDDALKALKKVVESGAPEKASEPAEETPQKVSLHELAFTALYKLNHPADTKLIGRRMAKEGTRKPYANVYQALEYRRKHVGDVTRQDGVWRIVKGH